MQFSAWDYNSLALYLILKHTELKPETSLELQGHDAYIEHLI